MSIAPPFRSLSELLYVRGKRQADDLAFRYLEKGTEEQLISYAELDRRAGAVAAQLRSVVPAGERALLLFPPGLDNVVALCACFYAGVVAVPAYPPDPARLDRTLPRLLGILRDARAKVVLSTSDVVAAAEPLRAAMPELAALTWLSADTADPEGHVADTSIEPEQLALIQYTSGSTDRPRGVLLSHGNLLWNSAVIAHAFGHSERSRPVIWLPPFHDMGLIGGIIQPLFLGVPGTLLSPMTVLGNPYLWLRAITLYDGTSSGGPDFGFRLAIRRVRPEQRESLDLRTWDVAFNGSEPVRAETLEAFTKEFSSCGFQARQHYPCYGLAESTLLVTGGTKEQEPVVRRYAVGGLERGLAEPCEDGPNRTLVGCGVTGPEHDLLIVHPETREVLPERTIGEIWLSGPSVASGYWDRPELTEQLFKARTATGEGPFLRTGDLGFLDQGELFITGRAKDLMIIRGRNVHPHDVEHCAEASHAGLRRGCSAAFTLLRDEERLVLVGELAAGAQQPEEVVLAVRRAVARELDLQVQAIALLAQGSVPKTSSGKIQRALCRRRYQEGGLEIVHAWSLTPELLSKGA